MRALRMIMVVPAAVAAIFWLATSATAQFGPCAEDLSKFCKDVPRGGGRMLECLTEHEANLSAACKAHVEQMKAEGRPKGAAKGGGNGPCAEDMGKFCKDVQAGGGRGLKCLREHKAELSEACKAHLEKMKTQRRQKGAGQAPGKRRAAGKAVFEACQSDIDKLCKDVKPGGGRVLECLKSHDADLSSECKTALEK